MNNDFSLPGTPRSDEESRSTPPTTPKSLEGDLSGHKATEGIPVGEKERITGATTGHFFSARRDPAKITEFIKKMEARDKALRERFDPHLEQDSIGDLAEKAKRLMDAASIFDSPPRSPPSLEDKGGQEQL